MQKMIFAILFCAWLWALSLTCFGTYRAFGIGWWLAFDPLIIVRIWILVSIYLAFSGILFRAVAPIDLLGIAGPWAAWVVYSTTIDGKSLTNFMFIDGPLVTLISFAIVPVLGFKEPQKRRALIAAALALELVCMMLVVNLVPIVGD